MHRDMEALSAAKGGTWYLVARVAEGFRTYRVSRIREARVLPEPFTRPAGFELGAGRSLDQWRASVSPSPQDPADERGWVTRRVGFEDEEQACFVVLGFGSRAEVAEPEALRRRVAAEVVAMVDRTHSTLPR